MTAIFGIITLQRQQDPLASLNSMLAAEPALTRFGVSSTHGPGYAIASSQYLRHRPGQLVENKASIICADARLDGNTLLQHQLGLPGNPSPAQLISAAWDKWQSDAPKYLYGDYAYAVLDPSTLTTTLTRDHVGSRPLYYFHQPGTLIFSSTMRALLASPAVGTAIKQSELARYLINNKYLDQTNTMFTDIFKVKPGCSILFDDGRIQHQTYWSIDQIQQNTSLHPEEQAQAFSDALNIAIRNRMQPGEKVASHLSGGLDSTLITLLADEQRTARNEVKINGYSWSPPPNGEVTDELYAIDWVQRNRKIPVRYYEHTYESVQQLLDLHISTEHTANFAEEISTLQHAKGAETDVILSGWGGDEFASNRGLGYELALALRGRWIQWARYTHACMGFNHLLNALGRLRTQQRVMLSGAWFTFAGQQRYKSIFTRFAVHGFLSEIQKTDLYFLGWPSERVFQPNYWNFGHIQERIESWHPIAARLGIEYRYPLLDRALIELVFSLPYDATFTNGKRGSLMFPLFQSRVPPEIYSRQLKNDPNRFANLPKQTALFYERWVMERLSNPNFYSSTIDIPKLRDYLNQYPGILREYQSASNIVRLIKVAELTSCS